MTDFDAARLRDDDVENHDLAASYDFEMPPHLIAQQPASPRDHARLMRLERATGAVSHHRFDALPSLLRPGDLLVFNDTRVLRARLRGYKINATPQAAQTPTTQNAVSQRTHAPHEYSCDGTVFSTTAEDAQSQMPVGVAADGRGGRVEALLLRELESGLWEALLKPSARLRPGTRLCFHSGDEAAQIFATPVERTEAGWTVRFEGDLRALLPRIGEVPLPPYIESALRDEAHYQTIFARGNKNATLATTQIPFSGVREDGASEVDALRAPHMSTHAAGGTRDGSEQRGTQLESAAAPTAGLHFMERTFAELHERGIATAFVTLQIGIGTFRPIKSASLDEHAMHREEYEIPLATQRLIARQRALGRRVVAVGTTTTRVLEAACDGQGGVFAGNGRTDIFIRPGHRFAVVDALLTNFHLPRSSLLVMIAAFAEDEARSLDGDGARAQTERKSLVSGLQKIRYAYSRAVAESYRFFSFGDAMFIE
jgi:S-adenosylmethionine:tRNA ribosyltransferase-isomerase